MQLSFFPSPYPDEALYSIAARYHESMGWNTCRETINDLFGEPFVSASIGLPAHLGALANRLGGPHWAVDQIIAKHTLFPYFAYFSPKSMKDRLAHALASKPPPSPAAVLGAMAARVKDPMALRYCPECVVDDRNSMGESYWHRSHQLPGVMVCGHHYCALQNSCVSNHKPRTRHKYYSLEGVLATTQSTPAIDLPRYSMDPALAADSTFLLGTNSTSVDKGRISATLVARLRSMGWLSKAGHLRITPIKVQWNAIYTPEFRAHLRCGIDQLSDPAGYLRRLLYQQEARVHPLLAILLVRMLGLTIEALDLAIRTTHYTDTPTHSLGACPNSLCPARGTTRWMYKKVTTAGQGLECCGCCGMECRTPNSPSARPQIVARGHLWINRLQTEISRGALSLRQLSKVLDVDPLTIKRYAQKLGLPMPWTPLAPMVRTTGIAPLRISKRQQWQTLRTRYPELSRTGLKRKHYALWTWLYRNDRDWLVKHVPPKHTVRPCRTRISWDTRDRQLCLDLIASTRELLREPGRPIRVTLAELGRRIGNTAVFHPTVLAHLPRVARLARRLKESREHHAKRRIEWCARQYIDERVLPERWQLTRRAGLRPRMAEACSNDIEAMLAQIARIQHTD